MAEERNLGLARAPESSGDTDATKAELQRRMEEARESISQTVTEIKDTVVNQYQQVRETISDTLDWREQYKRHTLPITLGAVGVGFLVGYTVMGAFKSDGDDYDEEDEAFDRIESGFDRMQPARSYAASPILGQAHAPAAYQRTSGEGQAEYAAGAGQESEASSRPSYSSGYQAATAPPAPQAADEEEEDEGPGLFSRFKETKAYDKLTEELSTIGERAVEELSKTAQAVVVPLLLNKLKSWIGVDLTTQQGAGGQPSARAQTRPSPATGTQAGGQSGVSGTTGSTASAGTTGAGGSSAYTATSGTGQS
jgi:uncharacterized protein YjbJ (UPF0337 family)